MKHILLCCLLLVASISGAHAQDWKPVDKITAPAIALDFNKNWDLVDVRNSAYVNVYVNSRGDMGLRVAGVELGMVKVVTGVIMKSDIKGFYEMLKRAYRILEATERDPAAHEKSKELANYTGVFGNAGTSTSLGVGGKTKASYVKLGVVVDGVGTSPVVVLSKGKLTELINAVAKVPEEWKRAQSAQTKQSWSKLQGAKGVQGAKGLHGARGL